VNRLAGFFPSSCILESMSSPELLTRLFLAALDDAARISSLLDVALQQGAQPAFELSPQGAIWYLNQAAADTLGIDPQQAVNTRLANYLRDGLMTQRRLEALSRSQSETWQDTWRRGGENIPCELTAFAIPASVANERSRILVWAKPPESALAKADIPSNFSEILPGEGVLSPDAPILGRDLERLRERFDISTHRFCEVLGISTVTWYGWRKRPDAPISSRPIILHLRLLDSLPELARLGAQPIDLQEALRTHWGVSLTFSELALRLGVERRSGYAWSRGYPASDQVRALTASLLYVVLNRPRDAWLRYQHLLERQAALEGVDIAKTHSWSTSHLLIEDALDEVDHATKSAADHAKQPRSRPLGTGRRGRPRKQPPESEP
jgi:DNA-binding transcriptional regulator YiaG